MGFPGPDNASGAREEGVLTDEAPPCRAFFHSGDWDRLSRWAPLKRELSERRQSAVFLRDQAKLPSICPREGRS